MTDRFDEMAREIVDKIEHGDEVHRKWLRDTAIPLIAAKLRAVAGEEREKAIISLEKFLSVDSGDSARFTDATVSKCIQAIRGMEG